MHQPERFRIVRQAFIDLFARPETFCSDCRTPPDLPVTGDRWGGGTFAAASV